MTYYALMSVIGSVLGWSRYFLSRKKAARHISENMPGRDLTKSGNGFRKMNFNGDGRRADAAAYAFQVSGDRLRRVQDVTAEFCICFNLARVIRYFGLGFLAVRYGDHAKNSCCIIKC